MDKVLISALATGSCASALTALIGGLFQRSSKNTDGSIARRQQDLQINDQSFKQLQAIQEETKSDRDRWKTECDKHLASLEKASVDHKEAVVKLEEHIAKMQEANVFLIMAALRNNNLEDLEDIPMTSEMRRLYDLAVRNAKPAQQLLDHKIGRARDSP